MEKSLEKWQKELEESIGRSLEENEQAYLECLSKVLDKLEWRDHLTPGDIALFEPGFEKDKSETENLSVGFWREPPSDEYSIWPYIAFCIQSNRGTIPDFLSKDERTEATRQEILNQRRAAEINLWKNRLGNVTQRLSLSTPNGIDVRLKLNGRLLVWEARSAEEAPYATLPAKEMGQWLSKEYGFLDRFATPCLPLCALFQDYFKYTQRSRLDLDKAEDCSFLNKLLHNPDTNCRIVNRSGTSLTYSEHSLKWHCPPEESPFTGCYELELVFENGNEAPLALYYLPGENPLYLSGETIYRGPPMLYAGSSPNAAQQIPAAALESPDGLLFLRSHNVPLPAKLEGNIIAIPLKPRIYCHTIKSEAFNANGIALEAKVYAVSRDSKHWFALTSDGWIPSNNQDTGDAPQSAEQGALYEYPNAASILEILNHLELEEEDEGCWSRDTIGNFPQEFVEWVSRLPSQIQLIPNDELDTLIDGRPAGRYALHVSSNEQQDWFNLTIEPEMLDLELSDSEQKLIFQANGEYVYLPDRGWRRFDPNVNESQANLLDTIGIGVEEAGKNEHSIHALQLAEADLGDDIFQEHRKTIKKRAKEISNATPAHTPKGMKTELRPYQLEGFQFLSYLSQNGFGGILADDMGLGKTLQSLTWITWLKHRHPRDERFQCLVICPKSVVNVWIQEVKRHCSFLEIAKYDTRVVNAATWQASNIDILVANYSQLRINRGFFSDIDWKACILDEGQFIKNPQSQTAKVAQKLNSEHRIVLTGTPIENRALDLWSLFSYAMPGLLGNQTSFKRHFKETDIETPKRLSSRVKHFLLRRKKSQVAPDLPDRIEETITCQMEPEQRELYDAELKTVQKQLLSIKDHGGFDRERFSILASLMRLRQICCHPQLLDGSYANIPSAKLEALKEQVVELRDEGHKVLIFSQFVEMLKIIAKELDTLDCKHLTITGATENREELVEQFQTDESVTAFLLSLRAAGSGLNLTAASYVILYDPWWNPAVEAQAIDRTHRIGQKNAVNAYRLISTESVEEKIQSMQMQKEDLANQIIKEESLGQILDLDSLRFVLGGV